MVGFPGEDENEFERSIDFVKRVGFAKVHTFAYSRRPGTVADRAKNQVQKSDKDKRSKMMIQETEKLHQAFLRSQRGKTEKVLFETRRPDGLFEGYTMNYTQVYIKTDDDVSNQILKVRLDEIMGEGCVGTVVE